MSKLAPFERLLSQFGSIYYKESLKAHECGDMGYADDNE